MKWIIEEEVFDENYIDAMEEALEDLRAGKMITTQTKRQGYKYKPHGFPSELADILIRVLDMAEWLGLDMESEVKIKNEFNETRAYKHGNKAI